MHYLFRSLLLLICHTTAASETPPTLKQKLTDHIARELTELNKDRDFYATEFPDISIHDGDHPVGRRFQYYVEQEQSFNRLQTFINNQADERLPDALWARYRAEQFDLEYYELRTFLRIAGDDMIPIYHRSYVTAPPEVKETILDMAGLLKSWHSLLLIKKGLNDRNQKVSAAAQDALKYRIGWLSDKPELTQMLVKTNRVWMVKKHRDSYSISGTLGWYQAFFQLVKTGGATLYDLKRLGAVEDCPEQVIGENLDLLIPLLLAEKTKQSRFNKVKSENRAVSRDLLLTVKRRKYLRQFHPLFTSLLLDRYHWGGKNKTCYISYLNKPENQAILGFSHYSSDILINRIAATLSIHDLAEWQSLIPENLLSDMFLQAMIAKKKGEAFISPIKHYPIKITVIDRSNDELLVSQEIVLNAGETTDLLYASRVETFPDIAGSLKAQLDTDAWMIRLNTHIDFKPHGVIFDCLIPLTGSGDINLTPGHPTKWIFEHLYQPK